MGIKDTSTPDFTLMLVMLHTGTMFAVVVYFWNAWRRVFFSSKDAFLRFSTKLMIGTAVTGIIGYPIMKGIEMYLDPGYTTLASQGLCEMGSKPALPTPSTPLTHVAAIYAPQTRLFSVGDTLTLQGTRGGDDMASQTAVVAGEDAPKKKGQIRTLKDLMAFCQDGLDIDPKAEAPPKGTPGVTLKRVEGKPQAMQIEVIGNTGHENRLKMSDTGFINQKDVSILYFSDVGKAEIEQLFKNLKLISIALAAAGVLILYSGLNFKAQRYPRKGITTADSVAIGAIQGLCLPFRGFSRSGATISLGLLRGVDRSGLQLFRRPDSARRAVQIARKGTMVALWCILPRCLLRNLLDEHQGILIPKTHGRQGDCHGANSNDSASPPGFVRFADGRHRVVLSQQPAEHRFQFQRFEHQHLACDAGHADDRSAFRLHRHPVAAPKTCRLFRRHSGIAGGRGHRVFPQLRGQVASRSNSGSSVVHASAA
jgi:hypothetical protein